MAALNIEKMKLELQQPLADNAAWQAEMHEAMCQINASKPIILG
jgi:hypothetical protein